jgi:diguanylate cyclase (GGDEF)-like protein
MHRLFEHRTTTLLRKLAIRHRLIAAFALVSLLPLLISGYVSYAESTREIEDKTRLLATEIVKQVSKNVELQMSGIETASEALVLSAPVQSALARYALDDPAEKSRARSDLTRILLDAYGSQEDIGQKYFLGPDQRILDPQVFARQKQGVTGFVAAARQNGRPTWGTQDLLSGQKSIVLLRPIYFKSDNRPAGSLFLGIRPSFFSAVFDDVHLGDGSNIFIVDARRGGGVVQTRDRTAGGGAAPALLAHIADSLAHGRPSGFLAYTDTLQENRAYATYLAAYAQIANTNWYVVSTLPDNALLAEAKAMRDRIVLIGALCFVFAVALATVIARSISAPLEKLAGVMRETETGNYAPRLDYEGRDELALLAQKFNDMAGNIGQAREQLESRVAERTRDLEQANEKLAALSMTDSLTGIANRRHFDAALESQLHRSARTAQPLALLMVDVDYFKSYNDFYGHQAGDACLRKIAQQLQAHARRAGDLAARYGGEEFVMLAADTGAERAATLAQDVRAAIEAAALPHKKSPIGRVTVSIGVAVVVPDDQQTPELFIRMADKAMYRAKEQGRNQVVTTGLH